MKVKNLFFIRDINRATRALVIDEKLRKAILDFWADCGPLADGDTIIITKKSDDYIIQRKPK